MTRDDEMLKSWLRLCADPRTTSDLLENASYWESINYPESYSVRLATARHRSTNSELLAKLSLINHLPIQIAVAGHPNLSEETAGKLLRGHLRELRRALASNPKIPFFVMNKLSRDFKDVRVALARNTSLPRALMQRLSRQREYEVRAALAANRSLIFDLMENLSQDQHENVRAAIAMREDLPVSGLRQLAKDKAAKVREAVLERSLEDYPFDREIFKAIAKFKPSLLAQRAAEHLQSLDNQDKVMKSLEDDAEPEDQD